MTVTRKKSSEHLLIVDPNEPLDQSRFRVALYPGLGVPILVTGALQAHAFEEGDVASISTERVHLRIDL